MAILRAQVVLDRDTSLPEDVSINTFHFQVNGDFALPAAADPIHIALNSFYTAIDDFLSPVLKEAAVVKYYDIGAPQPNPPIVVKPMTLILGVSTVPLPEECAICLSFKSDPLSGAPPARRRGRVYIGPLSAGTTLVSGGRVGVNPAIVTQLANAGGALLTASEASSDWNWVIYSPTSRAPGSTPDSAAFPVQQGWVDNAFDTQRRRGPKAVSRTLFGV